MREEAKKLLDKASCSISASESLLNNKEEDFAASRTYFAKKMSVV